MHGNACSPGAIEDLELRVCVIPSDHPPSSLGGVAEHAEDRAVQPQPQLLRSEGITPTWVRPVEGHIYNPEEQISGGSAVNDRCGCCHRLLSSQIRDSTCCDIRIDEFPCLLHCAGHNRCGGRNSTRGYRKR